MADIDDWHWQWLGDGVADDQDNGRVHYTSVGSLRRTDNFMRIYKVGDPVIISGEEEDSWIAQIVDLFSVTERDEELREILAGDRRRRGTRSNTSYELMRVTLRWFYNQSDMNKQTLRRSSAPMPCKNEVYFSDHVEKDGYNDVQVIEGMAWLFPSRASELSFLSNPDRRYMESKDHTRIVRCFVNSTAPELPVRELESNELVYLLKHPSTDKDLFSHSRMRLYNSSGAVLKGTKRKRKRSSISRRVVSDEGDGDDTSEPDAKRMRDEDEKEEMKLEETVADDIPVPSPNKSSSHRRRKVIIPEDEDSPPKPTRGHEAGKHTKLALSKTSKTANQRNKRVPTIDMDTMAEIVEAVPQQQAKHMDTDEITAVEVHEQSRKKARVKEKTGRLATTAVRKSVPIVNETIDLDASDDEPLEEIRKKEKKRLAARQAKLAEASAKRKVNNNEATRNSKKQVKNRTPSPVESISSVPSVGEVVKEKSPANDDIVRKAPAGELDDVLKALNGQFQKIPEYLQEILMGRLDGLVVSMFDKFDGIGAESVNDAWMLGIAGEIMDELKPEMIARRKSELEAMKKVTSDLETVVL